MELRLYQLPFSNKHAGNKAISVAREKGQIGLKPKKLHPVGKMFKQEA